MIITTQLFLRQKFAHFIKWSTRKCLKVNKDVRQQDDKVNHCQDVKAEYRRKSSCWYKTVQKSMTCDLWALIQIDPTSSQFKI